MQGAHEFKTEIQLLSRVHHKNVVGLAGFCFDKAEQMLVSFRSDLQSELTELPSSENLRRRRDERGGGNGMMNVAIIEKVAIHTFDKWMVTWHDHMTFFYLGGMLGFGSFNRIKPGSCNDSKSEEMKLKEEEGKSDVIVEKNSWRLLTVD
ncbi:hypothetical protein CQW23_12636 [Capsicum baccatum]|uniref:Serine-threonine/tyrosine-protein kinase catalytic domain-containing protein n=1 Tax=Capsicum baccatum TaxID=33114 RepID=A0A2G2WT34_CAPBA|nr:hypothetical protein CQW23_12636 [Capsicum baccatum]